MTRTYLKPETLGENSIEKLICEPISELKPNELSEELSLLFMRIRLNESDINNDEQINRVKALSNEDLRSLSDDGDLAIANSYIPAIYRRVKYCFDYELDNSVLLFLSQLINSFSEMVQYLTYFQYQCYKHNYWIVNMNFFASNIFPIGIPSSEDLQKIWDDTKVERDEAHLRDNLIDYPEYLKSIRRVK